MNMNVCSTGWLFVACLMSRSRILQGKKGHQVQVESWDGEEGSSPPAPCLSKSLFSLNIGPRNAAPFCFMKHYGLIVNCLALPLRGTKHTLRIQLWRKSLWKFFLVSDLSGDQLWLLAKKYSLKVKIERMWLFSLMLVLSNFVQWKPYLVHVQSHAWAHTLYLL